MDNATDEQLAKRKGFKEAKVRLFFNYDIKWRIGDKFNDAE
jgi:hypothetical protein